MKIFKNLKINRKRKWGKFKQKAVQRKVFARYSVYINSKIEVEK